MEKGKTMTKKKKMIMAAVAIFIAILVGVGAFFGVQAYRDSRISFPIEDTLADGQGRKATVILLGGQSNASGCSRDDYLQKNVSSEQYAEYEAGYDNVYINYYATGTNASNGFVKCATRQGEAGGFFGPELGLAQFLHEKHPDRLFFIIKYAWGGSNLYKEWRAPSSFGMTGQLYKEFEVFVETSMAYLVSKNYNVTIEGMCWMQGESDAFSVKNATDYENNLKDFIKDVRKKFSKYAAPDGIAFVDACIADNPAFWVYCDEVNASKQAVAAADPLTVLIDTNAYGLTCSAEPEDTPDMAHYDSVSQIKLGNLFGEYLMPFLEK